MDKNINKKMNTKKDLINIIYYAQEEKIDKILKKAEEIL